MPVEAFEKMAQPGFIKEVGSVLAGYSAAGAMEYGADRFTQRDLPGEVFGVATVAAVQYAPVVSGQRMRQMQVGAAGYAGLSLADRLGIADSIKGAI